MAETTTEWGVHLLKVKNAVFVFGAGGEGTQQSRVMGSW